MQGEFGESEVLHVVVNPACFVALFTWTVDPINYLGIDFPDQHLLDHAAQFIDADLDAETAFKRRVACGNNEFHPLACIAGEGIKYFAG